MRAFGKFILVSVFLLAGLSVQPVSAKRCDVALEDITNGQTRRRISKQKVAEIERGQAIAAAVINRGIEGRTGFVGLILPNATEEANQEAG
jgi:hypothetical protein